MLISIDKDTTALVIGFATDVLGVFAIALVLVSMSGIAGDDVESIISVVVTIASILSGIAEMCFEY